MLIAFCCLGISSAFTQPMESADFEQFSNGTNFTQASWQTAGFTVPWVNGFNVNRATIDNSQFKSGSRSLRLFYPKGQFGTANTGGQAPLMVPPLPEYYTSYYLRFSDDFSWGTTSEGGKLPGLSGGDRCSGCAICTGSNGFTARLMWRTAGKAVVYLYHLNKENPPCGDNYDIVVGGKTLFFQKGVWYKISQRLKVNTGTDKNGEVEMWINDQHAQVRLYDGSLTDKLTGIQFVNNGDKVDALYFSTFHGGSDATWAPTTDSYTWFDDIVISTQLADVVKSTVTSLQDSKMLNLGNVVSPLPLYPGEEASLPILKETEIEWLGLSGNVLCRTKVSSEGKTSVPQLSSGSYILRYTQNNKTYTKRIIIK